MKTIEHRRHTMRTKPGKHLSQAGVTLARQVGAEMGRFDLVLTSTVTRAYETAVAMGFAVNKRSDLLSSMDDAVTAEAGWDAGFAAVAAAAGRQGALWQFGQELAELLSEVAESLPDGGRGLVVSHGGIVEVSVIGCLPDLDYEAWGEALGFCEGVRLNWESGDWTGAEVIRVAQAPPTSA
jgi:broad specificity phosphatase PhoE